MDDDGAKTYRPRDRPQAFRQRRAERCDLGRDTAPIEVGEILRDAKPTARAVRIGGEKEKRSIGVRHGVVSTSIGLRLSTDGRRWPQMAPSLETRA